MGQSRLGLKIGGITILLGSENFSFQRLAEAFHQFTFHVASPDLALGVTLLPWKDAKFCDLEPSQQTLFSCFDRYYRRMYRQFPPSKEFDEFIESRLDWLAGYLPSDGLERRLRDYDEKDTSLRVQAYHVQNVKGLGILFLERGGSRGEVFLPHFYDHDAPFMLLSSIINHAYAIVVRDKDGLVLHSAGIAKDGRSYLFTGLSGSGKTTVARLSRNLTILADDVIPVKKRGDAFYASSTPWNCFYPPWNGSFGEIVENIEVEKLFFLNKGPETFFQKLKPADSVMKLARNCIPSISHFYHNGGEIGRILEFLSQFCYRVPCYEMQFNLSEDFWGKIGDL